MLFWSVITACDPTTGEPNDTQDPTGDSDSAAVVDTAETGDSVELPLPSCGWTGTGPYHIPDPGRGDGYCADREPNDDVDHAVPCGVVDSPISTQIYVAGHLADDDPSDWFVFTAGWSSDFNGQYSWWDTGTDLLDQVLYEVTDDCTNLVELHRWDTGSHVGENTDHRDGQQIEGGRIYAVQFLHVEGEGAWYT